MLTLQNSEYRLSINPSLARWSLVRQHHDLPSINNVHTGIYYHTRRGTFASLNPDGSLGVADQNRVDSVHGPLRQVDLVTKPDRNGMSARLVFALPETAPLMLMKMRVENGGKSPVYLDRFEFLNAGFVYVSHTSLPVMKYSGFQPSTGIPSGGVRLAHEIGDYAFFSNGWQSWNYSGVYGMSERYRRTRLGPFSAPMRVNPGTPHHRRAGMFGSDMFSVLGERRCRQAILSGFLSQNEQFGSMEALLDPFTPALRVWSNADGVRLDPGSQMDTDWLCVHFLHLDTPDPLSPYLDAVARQNQVCIRTPGGRTSGSKDINEPNCADHKLSGENIPSGWCSWYHYFQKVTSNDIRENLLSAQTLHGQLPLDLIQIDDGFEAQVGDWLDFSPSFPDGVAPLVQEISAAGFVPGIWLAPFIVHRKSRLAKNHPEWLLRSKWGLPVNAGFVWDSFTTALDLTQPGALDYASEVVRVAVHDWGYPYLKLDFLYAAALPGRRHDPCRTRAQVMRSGMEALRSAAGNQTYILGCGSPLGPAIGLVDAMRIGSDVDVRWHPQYKGISLYFKFEPDMPSARNAIHNSLTRSALHRRWWINDPDCLLLRPDTELSLAEVQSLATVIALTGGSLLLSDDLTRLPAERLKIAEVLLPLIGKAPYVMDWFDQATPSRLQVDLEGATGKWSLVGVFNWKEREQDLLFRLSDYYLDPSTSYLLRSFWDGKLYQIPTGTEKAELVLESVPAHGVVLLAIRNKLPGLPVYLGSDLHISQGLEVTAWNWLPENRSGPGSVGSGVLSFDLERPGSVSARVDLYLPREPIHATINNSVLSWTGNNLGTCSFHMEFQRKAHIEIRI